ncbi:Replication protein A [Aphelenchoides fujianensis]|nr:Replication protein A [Aphelenchoides fujianensis]
MDSGFDFTIAGGGWGGEEAATQQQAEEQRSPIPVLFCDLVNTPPSDDKFRIGNYTFQMLTVCGQLVAFENTGTELKFKIRDPEECGETCIDGQIFDPTKFDVEQFVEGQWVKVLGRLRAFGGHFHIMGYSMDTVENAKELRLHKVESQLAKFYYMDNGPEKVAGPTVTDYVGTALTNDVVRKPLQPQFQDPNFNAFANQSNAVNNLQGTQRMGGVKSEGDSRGLTGIRKQIWDFIQANPSDAGCHSEEVRRQIGNPPSFDQDLQWLANEGVIFNTVDENHFSVL